MGCVAVIGAGPAGLVAAKEALESGLIPIILEKKESLGGLWGLAGKTWRHLQTNLTTHSCSFSDYPWPEGTSLYATAEEMLSYLNNYAEAFDLKKHIRFKATVIEALPDEIGWRITYEDDKAVQIALSVHFLVVASGFFEKPFVPPSWHDFHSRNEDVAFSHSQDYKSSESYKEQNVVIIGGGFSGLEIATDVAKVAKTITVLPRTEHWCLERLLPAKKEDTMIRLPLDFVFNRRDTRTSSEESLRKTDGEYTNLGKYFSTIIDPALPQPEIGPIPPKVAISDGFREVFKSGKVAVKKLKEETVGGTLVFTDGSALHPDSLICATGFQTEMRFLSETVKAKIGFDGTDSWQPLLLYCSTLSAHFTNLAFVGMYRGPYFATMELQARLAMRYFTKRDSLPPPKSFCEGVESERVLRETFPRAQFPHGDYVGFSDKIASILGVKPPPLFEDLNIHGLPVTAAHYRLVGECAKPEIAKRALENLKKHFDKAT